jgi:hypothetical protein
MRTTGDCRRAKYVRSARVRSRMGPVCRERARRVATHTLWHTGARAGDVRCARRLRLPPVLVRLAQRQTVRVGTTRSKGYSVHRAVTEPSWPNAGLAACPRLRYAHAHMHAHAHARTHTHARTRTHTHAGARAHARTYTRPCTQVKKRYKDSHIHARTHARTHPCTHPHTHTHPRTHANRHRSRHSVASRVRAPVRCGPPVCASSHFHSVRHTV